MSTPESLSALCAAVQNNCNIADARHAADFTLCVYLLKMREYYRWEMGYSYSALLPKEQVGDWLKEREALWNSLEDVDYAPLSFAGRSYDPFDADAINHHLIPNGYVYSAGLGVKARPHFFLGKLWRDETFGARRILVTDDECARDLSAPPAMTREGTIFVRRESLRRMIWEKLQEWRWTRAHNAMERALAYYPFERDLDRALEDMTEHELHVALEHEIGEVMAEEQLGPAWREMLSALPRSRIELVARAVRDHLADALSTLPALIARQDAASLHFYAANLNGLRRTLFPAFLNAYETWSTGGDYMPLQALVPRAREHWSAAAARVLQEGAAAAGSGIWAGEKDITL